MKEYFGGRTEKDHALKREMEAERRRDERYNMERQRQKENSMPVYGGRNENISIDDLLGLIEEALKDVEIESWVSGTSSGPGETPSCERVVLPPKLSGIICRTDKVNGETIKNTAYIALMNPQNIARIMAEIKRLRNQKLQIHSSDHDSEYPSIKGENPK